MPAVARPPVLQWVSRPSPSWMRAAPCSAMPSQRRTSSAKMAWASALGSVAALMRSIAHMRFTAVGRAARRAAQAALYSLAEAPRSAKVPRQAAAATPMRGAPRTAKRWMRAIMATGSLPSSQSSSSGSRVWSSTHSARPSCLRPRDSKGFIGIPQEDFDYHKDHEEGRRNRDEGDEGDK